jgi:hypothetical protein
MKQGSLKMTVFDQTPDFGEVGPQLAASIER